MEKITKPAMEIYKDAPEVAVDYYLMVEDILEAAKGDKFVDKHPEVILELTKVAMDYYNGEMRTKALKELADAQLEAATGIHPEE